MAVTGTSTGVVQGTSLSLTRPGAANATGDLLLIATASISDGASIPGCTGFTSWYSNGVNRFSLYGKYAYCTVQARLGTASETTTYAVSMSGTATKTVLSGVCYRISNPLDTTTLANNRGARTYQTSFGTTALDWYWLTLTASGSVVIDVGSMLAATDPNAASLKLRTGDSEAYRGRQVESDAAAYYLAYGHGYRESQSGTVPQSIQAVTGNLGAMTIVVEVKQAAGGGGPPATGGGTGRVIYVGA